MAKKPKKSAVQRAKARMYKELLKRSPLMAPDPEPVRVTKVTMVPSKHRAKRARQRHAQLAVARIGADPRLV
jgi:hypothetical protein